MCRHFILSDEKKFQGTPSNRIVLVNRLKGERFNNENVVRNRTSGPSVNVWYYIGPKGKGKLFIAENCKLFDMFGNRVDKNAPYEGFDSDSYCYLLEYHALPSICKEYKKFFFLQDNASIHLAKVKGTNVCKCDQVFEKFNAKRVIFPAKSPDLNCIEQVHVLLQRKLDEFLTFTKSPPKNKKQLLRVLKLCWERVDNESVKRIYFSFLDRCLQVYKLKGNNNVNL